MLGKAPLIGAVVSAAVLCGCSARTERIGATASSITGGTPDATHAAVVATGHQVGAGMFCSGYLIMPDLVLTADHCTVDPSKLPSTACSQNALTPPSVSPADMVVVPGQSIPNATTSYAVVQVDNVPDYAAKTLCGNDLAVLQLAQPLSGIEPIALRLDTAPELGQTLTLVGYGQTDPTDPNSVGERYSFDGAHVDHVGYEQNPTGVFAVNGEFSVDKGPCAGDSGGPALDANGSSVGVMSRGDKSTCTHMVYSSVAAHSDWLRSLALASAGRLGVTPPAWAEQGAGGASGASGASGVSGASGASGAPPGSGGAAGAGTGSGAHATGRAQSSGGCALDPAPRHRGGPLTLVLAMGGLAVLRRRRR